MQAMDVRDWPLARRLAGEALAAMPQSYEARQVRALAALHGGDPQDALAHAEALVERFPSDPFAHNTYGAVLQALGRVDKAMREFQKAASLAPRHPVAWINLGQMNVEAGRDAEGAECFQKVVELGVATPQVHESLAWANVRAGRTDAALPAAREAARGAPHSAQAAQVAAHCELESGDMDAALDSLRRLETLAPPAARWRFMRSIAWPPMVESREQIARRHAEVDAALDYLIAHPAPITDPLREVATTAFYMAYQGFDDTALQRKIAEAYRLATPGLEWTAPHVATRKPGARIRLGIVGRHLTDHTIGKLNIGIAQKLDRRRFEVIVMRPPSAPDFLSGAFDGCADAAVSLPFDLPGARARIAEAELDAIFYPDIGMEPLTYFLAFARLARVQFTTWGHPVTTGIPNVDFFLSPRAAEPRDAQRFYRERLVQTRNPPSYYYRPRPPSSFDLRSHLGLRKGERIYASPQTMYKMHPDFDDALAGILRRDREGRVVVIAAAREGWNAKLRARLRRAGPDVADRIVFLPALSLPDYLALLRDADALLDTFHFGGGCSSYESFGMSAPVVTLPGERMRARITAALYARMGQSRWIARDAADYVELALRLAHGGAEREAWRAEIADGAARFMENDDVVREYEEFIESAVAGSLARES